MVYIPYTKIKAKGGACYGRKFQVEFFETDKGTKPAKEFLDSLDMKMRAKILRLLVLLEENGNNLREPYNKPLGNDIFELRGKVGSDITRMLYFFYYHGRIIITNGFVKKTQKTPTQDKKLAEKYRAIFLAREAEKDGKYE